VELTRRLNPLMEATQVIETTLLVSLPTGQTMMFGAPPEALKVLLLWEYPAPSIVVLPPDPIYSDGINQASFEFLLYNHMFLLNGLRDRKPFVVVCDPEQRERIEILVRHMLRGPSDEEMSAWRTPASHRKQLLLEMAVVSGEVAKLRLEQMVRVVPFVDNRVELGGTLLENLPTQEVRVTSRGETMTFPRRAQGRPSLPLYFADVETPVTGPRLGLQVIGSASGFSGAEWSSCYIIWINGQPLIVDGTPYLDDHLRRLGIEDDQILGYLITHNHEDHANMIGQLVSRRPVTVLTSGPVMASLVARLAAILECPPDEARRFFKWVPLHPGMDSYGPALHWFGAEIRTWYSVHTIPTLGVDISMNGKHIRMPGDTLWGRQLDPLLEQRVITRQRYDFIQHTYDGADIIVADAGGGPVHPDPQEVSELAAHSDGCCFMVTHVPESARKYLPTAEPGACVTLIPKEERTPEEAMGLFGAPALRDVPERWLLTLLYGGDVILPNDEPFIPDEGAYVVLAGCLSLRDGSDELYPLQRGDFFHRELVPSIRDPQLLSVARWTRLLHVPEALYRSFIDQSGVRANLERLFRTRRWWRTVTGEELGVDTLVELAELCRERHFKPGANVVRQGDPANHFYVVTEGEVEVVRRNGDPERVVGRFGPGFHFGEIALLGQEVRTATVRAATAAQVLELPARVFRRHLMEIPLARYHIGRQAARRMAELEELRRRGGASGAVRTGNAR
jgi:hypothetical protein